MELLEIPQSELLNYLPYSLIEEALEINPMQLLRPDSSLKESRINNYTLNKKPSLNPMFSLQDLTDCLFLEEEINKEIKKIMQRKSLFEVLENDLKFENLESQIKDLIQDDEKENQGRKQVRRTFN